MPAHIRSAFALALLMATAIPVSHARDSSKPAIEHSLRRTVPIAGAEQQRFSLHDRMEHYRVPGVSIAVIENCRVVDARAFGVKSWGGDAVTPGTLFQAGSFVVADALRLTLSPDLFARKFDTEEDSAIFDLLEIHLKTPAANIYPGDPAPTPPRPVRENV